MLSIAGIFLEILFEKTCVYGCKFKPPKKDTKIQIPLIAYTLTKKGALYYNYAYIQTSEQVLGMDSSAVCCLLSR